MLNLIQTEFLKLRRKKMIWVMLLVALIMPFFAYLYFSYLGQTNVDPMAFYKWSEMVCLWNYTIYTLTFCIGNALHYSDTR